MPAGARGVGGHHGNLEKCSASARAGAQPSVLTLESPLGMPILIQ